IIDTPLHCLQVHPNLLAVGNDQEGNQPGQEGQSGHNSDTDQECALTPVPVANQQAKSYHAEDHVDEGGVFAQPGWHVTPGVGAARPRRRWRAAGASTFVKCAARRALPPCGGRRSAPSRRAPGSWRGSSAATWRRDRTAPARGTSRVAAPPHYERTATQLPA